MDKRAVLTLVALLVVGCANSEDRFVGMYIGALDCRVMDTSTGETRALAPEERVLTVSQRVDGSIFFGEQEGCPLDLVVVDDAHADLVPTSCPATTEAGVDVTIDFTSGSLVLSPDGDTITQSLSSLITGPGMQLAVRCDMEATRL